MGIIVGQAGIGERGRRVTRDQTCKGIGRRDGARCRAVVDFGDARVADGRRQGGGSDSHSVARTGLRQRGQHVVFGQSTRAVGCIFQRNGADVFVAGRHMRIAGGGIGVGECLGADQAAERDMAGQVGRAVVGLAPRQR